MSAVVCVEASFFPFFLSMHDVMHAKYQIAGKCILDKSIQKANIVLYTCYLDMPCLHITNVWCFNCLCIHEYSHKINSKFYSKVPMVSEGCQTNGGLSNGSAGPNPYMHQPGLPQYSSQAQTNQIKPALPIKSTSTSVATSPPKVPARVNSQLSPPPKQIPPHIAKQLPGYKLQVYHLDEDQKQQATAMTTFKEAPAKPERAMATASSTTTETQTMVVKEKKHHHHHHHHHHHKPKPDGSVKVCSKHGKRRSQRESSSSVPVDTGDDTEASDRDMPELAPISTSASVTSSNYQVAMPTGRGMLAKQSSVGGELEEEDLGRKLSPLGSNSSLNDMVEDEAATPTADAQKFGSCNNGTLVAQAVKRLSLTDRQNSSGSAGSGSSHSTLQDPEEEERARNHMKPTKPQEHPPSSSGHSVEFKSPLHEVASIASSSSGSYSVATDSVGGLSQRNGRGRHHQHHPQQGQSVDENKGDQVDGLSHQQKRPMSQESEADTKTDMESQLSQRKTPEGQEKEEFAVTPQPMSLTRDVEKSKRKQELTLDLGKKKVQPAKVPSKDEESSLSSSKADGDAAMEASQSSSAGDPISDTNMFQRIPTGGGEVSKKRKAFEEQIRAQTELSPQQSSEERPPTAPKPKVNGSKPKTPMTRKILSEEIATTPGGSFLARSPAMHEGFRTEDWVVQKTPINTPGEEVAGRVCADGDKIIVGMINLSDEEEEEEMTSMHLDSEQVFKSGATTPPGGADDSMRSSLVQSSMELESNNAPIISTGSAANVNNGNNNNNNTPSLAAQDSQIKKEEEAEGEEEGHHHLQERQVCGEDEERRAKVVIRGEPSKSDEQKTRSTTKTRNNNHNGAPSTGGASGNGLPLVKPPAGFGDSPIKNKQEEVASAMAAEVDEVMVHSSGPTPVPVSSSMASYSHSSEAEVTACPGATSLPKEHTPQPHRGTLERPVRHKRKDSSTSSMTHPRSTSCGSVTPTRQGKSRSRSRSSSKERLLSKLADAANAPITPLDEDEVTGN